MTDSRLEVSPSTKLDGTVVVELELEGVIVAGDPFPILKEHA